MAESNANAARCLHLPRDTIMAAAALYQELYGQNEGVPATFQIIYMIGWKPNAKMVSNFISIMYSLSTDIHFVATNLQLWSACVL